MSHIETGKSSILHLDALKAAVRDMGAMFIENKKTFNAYHDHETCDHAIQLPGVNYEIGIRKTKERYVLAWDEYGFDGGSRHDGHKLIQTFGAGLCKLHAAYGRQVVLQQAKAHGFGCRETRLADGTIKLQLIPGVKTQQYQNQRVRQ